MLVLASDKQKEEGKKLRLLLRSVNARNHRGGSAGAAGVRQGSGKEEEKEKESCRGHLSRGCECLPRSRT